MREYTYGEIMKMQEDALRRVEDMRKKSDEAAKSFKEEAPALPEKAEKGEARGIVKSGNGFDVRPTGGVDSDTALLLSLLLLLSDEGADEELLLALLYILS